MLKLLKIVRDAGEVTIKYPFAPAEFTPTFRGKPEYDPKRCISCAACAIACPPNALTIETNGSMTYSHGTAQTNGAYWSSAVIPSGKLVNGRWHHIRS